MATEQVTSAVTTKTCQVCKLSVVQQPGTRRTMCPGCGNFYNNAAARQVRQAQDNQLRDARSGDLRERYAKLHRERQKKEELAKGKQEESQGPLQTIANFFHNLGPKKKNSEEQKSKTSSSPLELPDIDTQGRLTASNGGSRRSSPRIMSNKAAAYTDNETDKTKYPERVWTSEQLRHLYKATKDSNDWQELTTFYATTFESFLEINALFKKNPNEDYNTTEDSGIKVELVETVYEILKKAPADLQKLILKAIINCLIKDKRTHSKDELRAYLILSMNPLFQNSTTYVIFAHLLRQLAALSDHDHHFLVHWFHRLPKSLFKSMVLKLKKFISVRLYPSNPQELPPMSKCHWWIPSCCKALALLNAANNLSQPALIPHVEFYNDTLDTMDLVQEYKTWQNPTKQGGFSFCQYPFMLTIAAKRFLLQKESEQQMINQARQALVTQVQQRQQPDIEGLFLNLNVRRTRIVADSLTEVAKNKNDLKKKLKVKFIGEPGLDLGGLTKEWFLLLIKNLFRPEYGMFVYDKTVNTYWFSLENKDLKQKEYNLIGVLMGLAVYNGINLDIRLPFVAYKKLLSPAVVPCNNPNATVGVLPTPTLMDLESVMPDVAHSLKELLDYDGDVENDFCLAFEASIGQNGKVFTEELKKKGGDIAVTNSNRKEYVALYLDWILNKSMYLSFRAFYHGFHSVCASNALLTLQPIEVEVLVCGSPDINMDELKKVTKYEGFKQHDSDIKDFWELVNSMSEEGHKKLLRFVTGSDRIPASGMVDMDFKITRVQNIRMLPVAQTCFNQLILPAYNNKKVMKQKLLMAITNTEGFGLE